MLKLSSLIVLLFVALAGTPALASDWVDDDQPYISVSFSDTVQQSDWLEDFDRTEKACSSVQQLPQQACTIFDSANRAAFETSYIF